MFLSLNDRVTANNLTISIVYNGKTYTPGSVVPTGANTKGEASQWTINWLACDSNGKCTPQVTFNSGDNVTLNFSATNPGGTFTWSNTYTVGPPPPVAPGDIQGVVAFITN